MLTADRRDLGIECLQSLGNGGGRIEDAPAGRDPDELPEAEYGYSPGGSPFRGMTKLQAGSIVLGRFRTMRVHKDVGVDGDYPDRSIAS